ncbi:non-ribosomal peptide synthetase [Pyxidicoccus trucidator]|uniref:non-ribosomal peptide synthetase n=1 Tax=Pyxidicoccus trucidator TaxID=2709662 RepID=UPI0013DBAC98|nr:non-ribosomal peptide synthetase [Pyxidicoccus trucidator]
MELPLTQGQQALWLLRELVPDGDAYHVFRAVRLLTPLDVEAFLHALVALTRRHAALRTTFHLRDGAPHQRVSEEASICFEQVDARAWSGAALEEALSAAAREPFDLSRGPLLRVRLHARRDGDVLLLCAHHIVVDLASLVLLVRDLGELYAARLEGRPDRLPEAGHPAEALAAEQAYLARERAFEDEQYWRQVVEGVEPLALAGDRPRPPARGFGGITVPVVVEADTSGALLRLGRAWGVTPFTLLLAAFRAFLFRHTGQEDLAVGVPTQGRREARVRELVGYLVNPLPLRWRGNPEAPFREWVEQARQSVSEGLRRAAFPFPLMVERSHVRRGSPHSPVFQTLFAYERGPRSHPGFNALIVPRPGKVVRVAGMELEPVEVRSTSAQVDLSLVMTELDGALHGTLQLSTDLFGPAAATALAERWKVFLAAIAANPEARVHALDVPMAQVRALTEAERLVITRANETGRPHPWLERGVHELFEAQADLRPEALAVEAAGERLTYGELEARANRLASALRARGVGTESRVGVLLGPSADYVVALLAVLKAGAAYVAMAPETPPERVGRMLGIARATLVVTDARLAARVPAGAAGVLRMDAEREQWARESDARRSRAPWPRQLAYLVFTSGSAGTPKGVELEHEGLANLVCWHARRYSLQPGERSTQVAGLGFDASVLEVWPPLVSGAVLCLADEATRLEPERLGRWLDSLGAVVAFVPTPLAERLLVEAAFHGEKLRALLTGGDRLARRPGAGAPFVLVNHYGPTECTVVATAADVGEEGDGKAPSIGLPIDNLRAYVLDARLQPVAPGVSGELYLGGLGVGRGYAGASDLTAERFLPDPFSPTAGARMYRTGDLVHQSGDGRLEYEGRADQQVKVRGFRIELGEVESTLILHPAVHQAVVLAREDVPGDKRLVAWFTARARPPEPSELRAFLKERLPEYMVPSAFVRLEALPLTPNGKVDRTALPAPRVEEGARGEPARTEEERLVAAVVARVLGREAVGVEEDFFELGGHSLQGVRVVAGVREALGVELPLKALFEARSARGLTRVVEEVRARGRPRRRVERGEGPAEVTAGQVGMWLQYEKDDTGAAYNVPVVVRLRGPLRVEALEWALGEVVRRHEALRTGLVLEGGHLRARVEEGAGVEWEVEDLGAVPPGEREAAARKKAQEVGRRAFHLGSGRLVRAALQRLGEEEWQWVLVVHHVATDAWGLNRAVEEVAALYRARVEGRDAGLEEPGLRFRDYARWQREEEASGEWAPALESWKQKLGGPLPVLEWPSDTPRPAVAGYEGARQPVAVDARLTRELRRLGRQEGATLFMVVLAGFKALLRRYTGQEDVVVGCPVSQRVQPELESVVGLLLNTVAVRTRVEAGASYQQLLARVRQSVVEALAHQHVPFEKVAARLEAPSRAGRSPVFQVMMTLQGVLVEAPDFGTLEATAEAGETGTAKADLCLELREEREQLVGWLEYSSALFSPEQAGEMVEQLLSLLAEACRAPERAIQALELEPAERLAERLARWNDTRAGYPDVSVHGLFEQQAARTPDSVALRAGSERVTYAELERRANRLAHRLLALGLGPEGRVGLCLDRSVDMVVALLAVLKAGGCYVPLDPAFPVERLAFMARDAGLSSLLVQGALRRQLPDDGAVPVMALEEARGEELPDTPPAVECSAARLAYILYTSGSTGRPKGVAVAHGALVNFLTSMARAPGLRPDDVLLAVTTLSFDISLLELVLPLTVGAQAVIVPREVASSGTLLREALEREGASVMQATPSTWRLLLEAGWTGGPGFRALCGGEALGRELAEALLARTGEVWNLYGPTETAVWSSLWPVTHATGTVPLGRPIANTAMYVLDAGLRPVPRGVPGELFIGGHGLARGYHGRPDLTAERFLPDPFAGTPGARMYRTGDVARHAPDGTLHYLGRTDAQVKVRGHRIELGELEGVLTSHPAVARAVALVTREGGGEGQLAVFIVWRPGQEGTEEELRELVRRQLPPYMMPQALWRIDDVPLTPNGKVDRDALRGATSRPIRSDRVAPRTQTEQALARLWEQVLERGELGVHDKFFEVGGDSLRLMRLYELLERSWPGVLRVADLFELNSIEALGRRIDAKRAPPAPAGGRARAIKL